MSGCTYRNGRVVPMPQPGGTPRWTGSLTSEHKLGPCYGGASGVLDPDIRHRSAWHHRRKMGIHS